jgi:hypothetical protein
MPKYGTFKYGKAKYGRYDLTTDVDLSQTKRYRLRLCNSSGQSRPIVNHGITLKGLGGPVKVRIRANNGNWVYGQSITIEGQVDAIRIRAVSKDGTISPWVESVTGTIRRKGS